MQAALVHLFNAESRQKYTQELYNKMVDSYDGNGQDIITKAGGKLRANRDSNPSAFAKDCAIRLSYSLNGAGHPIASPSSYPESIRVATSENSGNFIYGTPGIQRYLNTEFGSGTVVTDMNSLVGKQGITLYENYHADLYDGSDLIGNAGGFFTRLFVNTAARYAEGHKVFFWEAQ